MRLKSDKATITAARRDRRAMTSAEVAVWRALRCDAHGIRFRRQSPAGTNRLDFYCAKARLAVEVDGSHHDRGDRPNRDAARDRRLAELGVLTLRIPAQEIYHNLDGVVAYIVALASERLRR